MSEIIHNQLFLGNVLNVNRLQWLNQKNIQTIVCVASKEDVVIQEHIRSCKTVHQWELFDHETQQLDFETVVVLIENALKQGAVLVNCAVGMSHSPSFVMAYLMKTKKISLQEAYRTVKQARPKITPNPSFMRQLQEYEAYLERGHPKLD